MRIFLSGLMGAGKSTVARALAARTGLPLFDLDQLLVEQIGGSISEFFAQRGEAAFRKLELTAIERLIAEHERAIVALGGGAVSARETRRRLLDTGFLVTLDASNDELARRVGHGEGRPLLQAQEP